MLRVTLASKQASSARLLAKVATRPRSRYTAPGESPAKLTRHPQMKQHLAVSAIGSGPHGDGS